MKKGVIMTNNKDLFYGILYLMLCIGAFFMGATII